MVIYAVVLGTSFAHTYRTYFYQMYKLLQQKNGVNISYHIMLRNSKTLFLVLKVNGKNIYFDEQYKKEVF